MSRSFAAWAFAGNGDQLNAAASRTFVAVVAVRWKGNANTVSRTNERSSMDTDNKINECRQTTDENDFEYNR